MQTLAPQVIAFLDQNDIPIEYKAVNAKPCSCGAGIDRWVYTQATTAAHYWYAQHGRVKKREDILQSELDLAKAEINQLKQRIFGKSTESKKNSEKQDANPNSSRNRGQQPGTSGHGRKKQNLETIEETIELPKDAACCASCQKPYEVLSNTEDSEIIEIFVKGFVRKIQRQKYRSCCNCPNTPKLITAPFVPRLIPKGILGTSVWASILMDKYGGHTPTHRYLDKLELYGIELAQGTVTDGLKKIMPLFTPVVQAIMEKNQQEKHWHADETRWEVFESIEGKVGSRWYLWMFKSASSVYFKLAPSRGYCVPKEFFVGTDLGILNCDRYVVYKKLETNGVVILALCWAHVRRDFLDIAKGYPELEIWANDWIERIGLIYNLNSERLAAKQTEIFNAKHEELKKALDEMAAKNLQDVSVDKCHFGVKKVLTSLSNHWRGLTIFVEHPSIPMDNNPAERELRGPVTGRKGYYGSGSIWSAELAAAMFTIIQTLRVWKLNPLTWLYMYLEYCLQNNREAPEDLSSFLPWGMEKEDLELMAKPPNLFPGFNTS